MKEIKWRRDGIKGGRERVESREGSKDWRGVTIEGGSEERLRQVEEGRSGREMCQPEGNAHKLSTPRSHAMIHYFVLGFQSCYVRPDLRPSAPFRRAVVRDYYGVRLGEDVFVQ